VSPIATLDIPALALSVRQPWAWAIIHGGKLLENRSKAAVKYMRPLTGQRAIHASKGMTRAEYDDGREFMRSLGIDCPAPANLLRGGIIGVVEVIGSVTESESPWFFGPCALVLDNPRPCNFVRADGALGYFRWSRTDSEPPKPARWMLPKAASIVATSPFDLFGATS
jgi:hypothetical protein